MQGIRAYSCHMESDFALWLLGEINRRGWKPADLARESELSESTVSRILSGARGTGKASLKAIAKALKVADTVVLFRAGQIAHDPDDPMQELTHHQLELLRLSENRTEAELAAALVALTALFDGLDRGKSGYVEGNSGAPAGQDKA